MTVQVQGWSSFTTSCWSGQNAGKASHAGLPGHTFLKLKACSRLRTVRQDFFSHFAPKIPKALGFWTWFVRFPHLYPVGLLTNSSCIFWCLFAKLQDGLVDYQAWVMFGTSADWADVFKASSAGEENMARTGVWMIGSFGSWVLWLTITSRHDPSPSTWFTIVYLF